MKKYLLLLFILPSLSGCLDGDEKPPDPLAFITLPASATYRSESTDDLITLHVNGTQDVMNEHLRHQESLLMTIAYNEPSWDTQIEVHLDSSWRIIRTRNVCSDHHEVQSAADCKYTHAEFFLAGTIPPWAIGLPMFGDDIIFTEKNPDFQSKINRTTREDGTHQYTISTPYKYGRLPAFFPEGTFVFDSDPLFPLWIQPTPGEGLYAGDHYGPFERESVSYGGLPLPSIQDPSTAVPIVGKAVVDGLFPEADEYLFDRPFTPSEALDYLLENSQTATSQLDDGCVTGFSMTTEFTNDQSLAHIFDSNYTGMTIDITDSDRQTTSWDISHDSDTKTGDGFSMQGSQVRDNLDRECIDSEIGLLMSPITANALRSAIPVSSQRFGNDDFVSFQYEWERLPSITVDPSPIEYRIAFTFMPEHIDCSTGSCSYRPYLIEFDAESGTLQEIRVHPKDLETWDDNP